MVSKPLAEMLARNLSKFAPTYQAPPGLMQLATKIRASGEGVVVLSCSDPRLNPYQILGLDSSLPATMVRNAGGRAFDAIRTLSVLQTIGRPGTIVVMHHTDCGMSHFHDADVKRALLEINPDAGELIQSMEFGEIKNG
ncbi:hypothetical protein PV08_03425 [Exophiala spinifera]|uniref:Carbonic anhydrase n=1 Tax=Exophiala spinifera TaxID=91928 RepID=A0A0D2BJP4_9EURO|nr:uncharacterized protein PV08_03425 [Exophiala spinifera]KIW19133.1 hypothetical protein PV08_03425 [Exophiala spinifera]